VRSHLPIYGDILKQITASIREETHNKLKNEAKEEDKSLSSVIRDRLEGSYNEDLMKGFLMNTLEQKQNRIEELEEESFRYKDMLEEGNPLSVFFLSLGYKLGRYKSKLE